MSISRTDLMMLIGFALLLVGIGTAVTFVDLAAEAEGPWRMIGLAGTFVVGLVAMWSLKSRAAALSVLFVAFALGTVLMGLRLDPLAYHIMLPLLAYPLAVWTATWLIVREVMPRLPRERAHMAAVVGGILLVLHLGTGFAMLTSAHAFLKLDEAPVIRDAATLAAAVPRGTSEDDRIANWGLLIEAQIAPVEGDLLAASRFCAPGGNSRSRIMLAGLGRWETSGPGWIDILLPDGTPVRVQRVEHARSAFDWPSVDSANQRCGLSGGDPVIIRAIPRNGVAGVELRDTTLIAYGSPEAFRTGYAPRAEFAARQFGGVAFLLMLSGLIPLVAGLLTWWRARRG